MKNRIFLFSLLLGVFLTACDSSTASNGTDCGENPIPPDCNPALSELTGSLYYGHGAHTFARYDFDTQTETSVFDDTGTGGFAFTVSPDGTRFAWADQYDADQGRTRIQIHETGKPSSYREVFLESASLRYSYRSLALAPGADGPGDIGRIVIVPVHTNDTPIHISPNVNGDILPDEAYTPFPIELESSEGKITANDPGAFWIPKNVK